MSETERLPEAEIASNAERGNERNERQTTRRTVLRAAGAAADSGRDGTDPAQEPTTFRVRVENVSTATTLETSATGDAAAVPVPLSPGAYAVHSEPGPFFAAGERARGNGLEALAEDGDPSVLADSLDGRMDVSDGGAFATPVGADGPAPIGPGGAYEFTVAARPGERLSLATMFVQSNDLFYAPEPRGIGLFDGEEPLSGDVTNALGLWDAGTERNEEPGVGGAQAPRQMGADTGPAEDAPVRLVSDVGDGYGYPYTSEVIRVTREVAMG
jgi:hypothetical protein